MRVLAVMAFCFFLPTLWGQVELHVLGTVQDAGAPQLGCKKACCVWAAAEDLSVVSLGLVDRFEGKSFLIEASPDLPAQMSALAKQADFIGEVPDAILLTHAHIGHYTGLMYLGRESVNSSKVPVHAMPQMMEYLSQNGPWNQLVALQNIVLNRMTHHESFSLSSAIKVMPLSVPHRDEYSETVGFWIQGPVKSALFIPDIDKWEIWEQDIRAWVQKVDYAFLDATFYDAAEVHYRPVEEIPHPFIIESLSLFENLPFAEKQKIHFIHMNHTNPALNPDSPQSREILRRGFHIARKGMMFQL
jgi:pyrroloquinoline quinone biosynthesis protein B